MRAPLNSSPIAPRRRASTLVGALAVAVLLLAGCGDSGDEESTDGEATTETTAPSSSTTEASTTDGSDAPSSETTASTPEDDGGGGGGEGTDTTAEPTEGQLSPGDPCSLEEGDPDCIDPDGDGEGVYLVGGADCAATAPDISVCEDLDGDGAAGYPDSEYGDLPTCSDEVPPPCNNPPGEGDEG